MKKLFFIFFIMFFTQAVFACDATLYPRKNYVIITQTPIKSWKIENEVILSGQLMATIFGEKNQLFLKPKNIGKTKLYINETIFHIEVSKEQKEEWNIGDMTCVEIDKPIYEKEGANND